MAVVMDQQQQSFNHFCRICKKGFVCGSALGGHMRAHGIGDEAGHVDDDKQHTLSASAGNPNRANNFQCCENYGKEFSPWNSFFQNGKYSSDDPERELLVSLPPRQWEKDMDGCGEWSKRRRTKRVMKVANPISNCKEEEEEELANCLVMLSKGARKGWFECKGCRKVFSSHQALGGHRASHKKVKGCSAAKIQQSMAEEEDAITHANFSTAHLAHLNQDFSIIPTKAHECSICHRRFASGQALGGHKRSHWFNTSNSLDDQQPHQRPKFNKFEMLDLNLPAPMDDKSFGVQQDNNHSSLHDLQLHTGIYLQQWIGKQANANNNGIQNKKESSSKNSSSSSSLRLDDEVVCRIKLAKLSDLKDINFSGDSSPWLQVGIGSTTSRTMTH